MEYDNEKVSLVLLSNSSETTSAMVEKDDLKNGSQWMTAIESQDFNVSAMNMSGGSPPVDIFSYPGVTEIFIFIYSILWLFCVIGNCLVLTVMTRSPALRTRTNLFLCHLAVADLSVGLVSIIPNLIVAKVIVWIPGPIGYFLCKFYNFFEEFSMTVSVLLLVLIAAERYVAIIHPLKARRLFTRLRMYAALGFVWLAASLYNAPLLVVYVTAEAENRTYCYREDGDSWGFHVETYVVFSFLLTYVLPLLLMVTMYVRISVTLWKSSPSNLLGESNAGRHNTKGVALDEAARDQKLSDGSNTQQKGCKSECQNSKGTTTGGCSQGVVSGPPAQCMTGEGSEVQSNRTDGETRSRSSCTSRTSSSSGSASTSNTTVSDDPSADSCRHDNAASHPLLGARLSDDSNRSCDQTFPTTTKCPRSNTACEHSSHSVSTSTSRRQRSISEEKEVRPQSFDSGMTSSTSAMPLIPPSMSAGLPSPAAAAAASGTSPPTTCSTLSTAGARDGVYVLRPGHTRNTSCRYRVTSHRVLQTRRKVVKLLIAVLSVFALCILPFHVLILVRYLMPGFYVTGFPKYIAQVLFFLNSALNPVLYSLMSDSFRRSARQVLCCSYRFQRPEVNAAGAFGAREARARHLPINRAAATRAALDGR